MSLHEINGCVFRVRHLTGGWLVEVPYEEDHIQALAEFCAEKALTGYHITSVTRIYECSKDTPRIGVLSTPEYKAAVHQMQKKMERLNQPKVYPESVDELIARAEGAGWSVSRDDDSADEISLELNRCSPAGEDFFFYVSGSDVSALTDEVKQYAFNFDQEDHVKSMMECRGNPGLTALVEDAEEIQEMLNDLAEAVMLPVDSGEKK